MARWWRGWRPRARRSETILDDALLVSNLVIRATEHSAVAEHRDRSILAHGDHGGEGVVVAVAATRRVSGAPVCRDGLLGILARHQPHAELTQHPRGVEHGRPVDL